MQKAAGLRDIEERGTLAAIHALGILDVDADPVLESLCSLATRLNGGLGTCTVWLRGPAARPELAQVAGTRDVEPSASPGTCVPLYLGEVAVGQVCSADLDRKAVAHVAAEVSRILSQRWAAARRDSHDMPVGVFVVDSELAIIWVSPEAEELGVAGGPLVGRPVLDIVDQDELSFATSLLSRGVAGRGRTTVIPLTLILEPIDRVPFDVWGDNRLADPAVAAMAFVARRASRSDAELALLGDQMGVLNRLAAGHPLGNVLHRVIDMIEHRDPRASVCVMEYDQSGECLHPLLAPSLAIPVVGALLGLPVGPDSPAAGGSIHRLIGQYTPDVALDSAFESLATVLAENCIRACWSMPIRSLTDGTVLGAIDVYRTVPGDPSEADSRVLAVAGRLAGLAIDHDARDRELVYQASHDPLTKLPNRALFSERLAGAAENGNVGVLFLDLDRFKLVNDTMGHAFGDLVLHAVARRLEAAVDEPVLVARFGGDEFTVLVPKVEHVDQLVAVGVRLLASIAEPYQVAGHRVVLGASAGAALAIEETSDPQSLVRDADTALYHAKDMGRGRVEVFDDRLLAAGAERVRVEDALRVALECNLIDVHFQPTVRVSDDVVVGAEALARCATESGEHLPPAVFIPVAEEVGLLPAVFEVVFSQACAAAAAWNLDRKTPFVVWVNLSPQQLGSVAVVDQIGRIIDASDASASMLGFEVTESGILLDPDEAAEFLARLRSLGARVALDDFGTGYSSLGYLQTLPVDTVKLDRSFVIRAGDDPRTRAIVGSVVDLTRAMDLTCVAEGVETQDQLDVMTELGCELVQGFIYARPMPADDVTRWLASRN
ncbi:MAG: EAL domain-containing protein [Aquihabitans sp.]